MAIVSGNGGSIKINGVTFHVAKWSANFDPRLVEVTKSDNVSGTRYQGVVLDPSGTVELPVNTSATPEAAGLTPGALLTSIALKVGASALYYTITGPAVGNVEPVCDNNGDVVRTRISWKGGDLTGPA